MCNTRMPHYSVRSSTSTVVAVVYTVKSEDLGKRTKGILEVFMFFGFGTPFDPLEDNLLEPNPVRKKYSHKTGLCEYSINFG